MDAAAPNPEGLFSHGRNSGVRPPWGVPSLAGMGEADEHEELLALTRGWSSEARAALLAAYASHRGAGASHEEALMQALGEVLP